MFPRIPSPPALRGEMSRRDRGGPRPRRTLTDARSFMVQASSMIWLPVIVFLHGAGRNQLSWWQQLPHIRKQ